MKILVTGGSGFVGRNLIPKLLQEHEVINLDIVKSDDERLNSLVKTIIADIRDIEQLRTAFQNLNGVDVIIHLAAESRENMGNEFPAEYFRVNIEGTHNVLMMAKEFKAKKVIFASSFLAYGNQPTPTINEELPLKPTTIYAATKAAGEAMLRAFSAQYGIDFVILRKCNLYGHGDPQKRVIDILLERARANSDITLFGDKHLDFVDINDAVDAYCAAVKFNGSDTFVIGSGRGNDLKNLAEFIIQKTKSRSKILKKNPAKGDLMRFVADISKARKMLNYNPKGDIFKFIEEKVAK